MKKLVAMLLVGLMVVSLVGCGSSKEESSALKIALVTDTLGSEQFLLQAYDVFMEMSEDGAAYTATSVECSDDSAWAEKSRNAAVQGYDLVIGIGWKAAGVFEELVGEFPDTKFAVIDTVSSNEEIKSVAFNTSDGAYIMGVLVGNAFADKTTFGYIGNFQNQANYEYRYGFEQGLLSVIPDASLVVNYADTYSDTSAVYSLAKQQAAAGASFIMGSVSSSANEGLYQAALDLAEEGKPIYTSGLSVDQTRSDNPYIVAGLTKDTGTAIKDILDEYLAGEFQGGAEMLGFVDDAFCVVHINTGDVNYVNEEIITADVLAAADAIADEMRAGNIVLEVPIES